MKIPRDIEVRTYELTYLAPSSFTETELSQLKEKVSTLVKKHKGTVVSVEDWGKKPLAYTIRHNGKKHDEAAYYHMVVSFESGVAQAFERDIYLTDAVIRHLFVISQPAVEIADAKAPKEEKKEKDATE